MRGAPTMLVWPKVVEVMFTSGPGALAVSELPTRKFALLNAFNASVSYTHLTLPTIYSV